MPRQVHGPRPRMDMAQVLDDLHEQEPADVIRDDLRGASNGLDIEKETTRDLVRWPRVVLKK